MKTTMHLIALTIASRWLMLFTAAFSLALFWCFHLIQRYPEGFHLEQFFMTASVITGLFFAAFVLLTQPLPDSLRT